PSSSLHHALPISETRHRLFELEFDYDLIYTTLAGGIRHEFGEFTFDDVLDAMADHSGHDIGEIGYVYIDSFVPPFSGAYLRPNISYERVSRIRRAEDDMRVPDFAVAQRKWRRATQALRPSNTARVRMRRRPVQLVRMGDNAA